MNDIDDNELALYYYKDGLSKDERLEIGNAIAANSELAARYKSLSDTLSRLADAETDAVPADMMMRFHSTIDRAAGLDQGRQPQGKPAVEFWSFFWGAAISAALAIGIGIGFWAGDADVIVVDDENWLMTVVTPIAFERSAENYFRESSYQIGRLPVDAGADRLVLIARMIEQNRLFEKAAVQNNSADLARVLRAFEPILVKLAADDIAPEDAEALRAKLAFELNVMLTKLSRDTSDRQQTTTEST